jgi:hypothetical protein
VRIVAAHFPPIAHFERAGSPADAEANLELALLTDGHAAAMRDAYGLLPNEDRLSGPGSGLLLPSWLFPAPPGRLSTGRRGGTCYVAGDEATARAETTHHYARELESSPAALAAARAAGEVPTRRVRVLHADLLALCLDAREGALGARDAAAWAALHAPDDYAAGQALEAEVRPRLRELRVDGVVYDSVRMRQRAGRGECAAIYRPRALRDARVAGTLRYRWVGPGDVAVEADDAPEGGRG